MEIIEEYELDLNLDFTDENATISELKDVNKKIKELHQQLYPLKKLKNKLEKNLDQSANNKRNYKIQELISERKKALEEFEIFTNEINSFDNDTDINELYKKYSYVFNKIIYITQFLNNMCCIFGHELKYPFIGNKSECKVCQSTLERGKDDIFDKSEIDTIITDNEFITVDIDTEEYNSFTYKDEDGNVIFLYRLDYDELYDVKIKSL